MNRPRLEQGDLGIGAAALPQKDPSSSEEMTTKLDCPTEETRSGILQHLAERSPRKNPEPSAHDVVESLGGPTEFVRTSSGALLSETCDLAADKEEFTAQSERAAVPLSEEANSPSMIVPESTGEELVPKKAQTSEGCRFVNLDPCSFPTEMHTDVVEESLLDRGTEAASEELHVSPPNVADSVVFADEVRMRPDVISPRRQSSKNSAPSVEAEAVHHPNPELAVSAPIVTPVNSHEVEPSSDDGTRGSELVVASPLVHEPQEECMRQPPQNDDDASADGATKVECAAVESSVPGPSHIGMAQTTQESDGNDAEDKHGALVEDAEHTHVAHWKQDVDSGCAAATPPASSDEARNTHDVSRSDAVPEVAGSLVDVQIGRDMKIYPQENNEDGGSESHDVLTAPARSSDATVRSEVVPSPCDEFFQEDPSSSSEDAVERTTGHVAELGQAVVETLAEAHDSSMVALESTVEGPVWKKARKSVESEPVSFHDHGLSSTQSWEEFSLATVSSEPTRAPPREPEPCERGAAASLSHDGSEPPHDAEEAHGEQGVRGSKTTLHDCVLTEHLSACGPRLEHGDVGSCAAALPQKDPSTSEEMPLLGHVISLLPEMSQGGSCASANHETSSDESLPQFRGVVDLGSTTFTHQLRVPQLSCQAERLSRESRTSEYETPNIAAPSGAPTVPQGVACADPELQRPVTSFNAPRFSEAWYFDV